jgi:CBS domain-containing protein
MNDEVTIREVMDREYVGVSESDDLLDTVEMMIREGTESVLVLRGSEPVGVVTERDVLAYLVTDGDPGDAVVSEAMTESIPTVAPELSLAAAADEMSAQSTKRLVVTDQQEPVGIVTEHDLLKTATLSVDRNGGPVGDAAVEPELAAGSTGQRVESSGFEDQSICEACGAFSPDLTSLNGQLLCPDCRDV